jgi:hypothetical protein
MLHKAVSDCLIEVVESGLPTTIAAAAAIHGGGGQAAREAEEAEEEQKKTFLYPLIVQHLTMGNADDALVSQYAQLAGADGLDEYVGSGREKGAKRERGGEKRQCDVCVCVCA